MILHTRFANGGESFSNRVHQMYVNEEGRPVASPLAYAGEMPAPVEEARQPGQYKFLLHERDINTREHVSFTLTLQPGGAIIGDKTGVWACEDGENVTIALEGVIYKGVMHTAAEGCMRGKNRPLNWQTCRKTWRKSACPWRMYPTARQSLRAWQARKRRPMPLLGRGYIPRRTSAPSPEERRCSGCPRML